MMNVKLKMLVLLCVLATGCVMLGAQEKGTIAPDEVPGTTVYIPYNVPIKIDGNTDDWKGVPVSRLTRAFPATPDKSQNVYIDFSVAADETNVYVRAESADSNIISGKHGSNFWNEDSIEFYFNFTKNLNAVSYGKGMMQVNISPVNLGKKITTAAVTGTGAADSHVTAFVYKTGSGWGFEASVPYTAYFTESHGKTIGFQIQANGASKKDRDSKLIWSTADTTDTSYSNPSLFGRGIFFKTGSASAPEASDKGKSLADTFKELGSTGKGTKKLVWADEFSKDGDPDPANWAYDAPDAGKYNHELQTYTDSRKNSYVKDGNMYIHAEKDSTGQWTSARLFTSEKQAWTYGYIEFRARMPSGKGTWPALWMMPQNSSYGAWPSSGEIDVMEFVGYLPDTVHTSCHTLAYYWRTNSQKTRAGSLKGMSDSFHNYAIEWNDKGIFWYVDDAPFYYFLNDGAGTYKTWPFNKRFYLIMNLAMGGDWGGQQGMDPKMTQADMVVDYVRVYQ